MNNIDKATSLGNIIGIASGTFFCKLIIDHLTSSGLGYGLVTLIVVAFVVLAGKFVESITKFALERCLWLRKFVAGRNYIEGNWLDYADGHYGIVSIEYIDGSLHVHGDALDEMCNIIYSWDSEIASFDGKTLLYAYRTNINENGHFKQRYGYLMETFHRIKPNKAPEYFGGIFVDFGGREKTYIVTGIKITPEEVREAKLKPANLNELASRIKLTKEPDSSSSEAHR